MTYITESQKAVIRQRIKAYGPKMQQVVAMEELAELTQAISKMIRTGIPVEKPTETYLQNRQHLIEEIADAQVMIEQLKIIHKIEDRDIELITNSKILRQERRLNQI